MTLDPRSWGRVAQAALVLLLLSRLPAVLAAPTAAGAVGMVLGTLVGTVLVVAVLRWLATILPGTGVGGKPGGQA